MDVAENASLIFSGARERLCSLRGPVPIPGRTSTVCVGGVAWGGDGKTPLARYVARRLSEMGMGVSVVTRGYGGWSSTPVRLDPGRGLLGRVKEARRYGDEPVMLASTLQGVDVWAGPLDRTIRKAIREEPDVLVVDDGLGLRSVPWDLCIALLSADRFVHRHVPAGPLRRPLVTTRRAHLVGIRAPRTVSIDGFEERVHGLLASADAHRHRWFAFRLHPEQSGADRPVHLASGIANVDRFERSARGAGFRITGSTWYPDHHVPSSRDLRKLASSARTGGAQAILVTAKDAPRFPRNVEGMEVTVLTSLVRVFANSEVLDEAIEDLVRTHGRVDP